MCISAIVWNIHAFPPLERMFSTNQQTVKKAPQGVNRSDVDKNPPVVTRDRVYFWRFDGLFIASQRNGLGPSSV